MVNLIQIHEPGETPLPHEDEGEIAIGIDLGTTNSLCAISENEEPTVISDDQGNFIVPSVLSLSEDGKIYVADNHDDCPFYPLAKNHQLPVTSYQSPVSISSIKRLMGKGLSDITEDVSPYGFDIIKEKSANVIRLKFGNHEITPIEASAEILKKIKSNAEKALGRNITKAVITVPAYFNDGQRQATKDAAKLSGLEVLRLINEPTAAALAYGLDKGSEGVYAVYDLGGGTFDVSILQMQMGVFRVLATGGDTQLGGDDIDVVVGQWALGIGNRELEKNQCPMPNAQALKTIARKAKEELSTKDKSEIEIEDKKTQLTRTEFEEIIKPIIDKTINIFAEVIKSAKIKIEDLKGVILVGGSTRIPLVRNEIEKLTKLKPLTDIDPDKIVAMGAAIQAEALTRGSSSLLLDVTPLSLGIETYGGLMEVLIHRNTPIPARASQKFTTYEDGQTAMKVHVLQGERELAKNCRSLAVFDVKGIPPQPAGTAVVEINFILDADGILSVSAIEETTRTETKIEVKPSYGLNSEEMEKMLLASMEQAQKDITERLLQEARVEAQMATKSIKSALKADAEIISKEYLSQIENAISELENACKGEDRELIHSLIQLLDKTATDFADARVSKALKGYLGGKKVGEV